MKTRHTLLLLPAVFIPLALIAQGPLTPPAGAPAPVMKTLQQVEPRTDVATLGGDATSVFLITTPGSYYLSGNITVPSGKAGIAIAAPEVTLDLNGFAVTGATGSVRGVELRNPAQGVTVRNGVITGVTAGPGVGASGAATLTNLRFQNLAIRNCTGGVLFSTFPQGASADHVTVTGCSQSGIDLGSGSASHCMVDQIAGTAVLSVFGIRCGLATACSVVGVTNNDGAGTGISAQEANGCMVTTVRGGAFTAGIIANAVSGCKVEDVTSSAAGPVTGISATGRVTDCRVESIGNTGPGSPTGIGGTSVADCFVSTVGDAATTGAIFGISSTTMASHCSVRDLGETGTAGNITGISAQSVSHCRASTLRGAGGLMGISADTAADSTVESLTQGAGSTSSVTGILAGRITACSASALSGNSTAATTGFTGYRHASGCDASTISNAGTGLARGFQTPSAGYTLHCTASITGDVGISAGVGAIIKGCTIRLSSTGTGIDVTGASGVVEDNTVSACDTGINATGANGLVVRNRITTCSINLVNNVSNQVGPVVTPTGTIASTSPWANFTD